MSQNPKTRRPVGRQPATPPRPPRTPAPSDELALPHERDESPDATEAGTDATVAQAQRDLAAGQVDTDMRATPGLDAERREQLVKGPGGQTPKPGR
jgi:hypothetical protein